MDIQELLRQKISALEEGDHMPGLRAVQLHIETAYRHLSRGRETADDTAFTDAVQRTNLAFEGSIKEAYRVLAGQDPARKRPFDIENYLEANEIFRPRVLSQFTRYRTEWRNPAAHDYKLDFDESESFLAIVSVTAFACVLLDQIEERLAFDKARAEAEADPVQNSSVILDGADLSDRCASAIKAFFARDHTSQAAIQSSMQLIGSLHGFLASTLDNATVAANVPLMLGTSRFEIDLMVSAQGERVVIEVKQRFRPDGHHRHAINQVTSYMTLGGISNGILLYVPDRQCELEESELTISTGRRRIKVLRDANSVRDP